MEPCSLRDLAHQVAGWGPCNLRDLAYRVAGREPCILHDLGHYVSWVESVLYRSCATSHSGRLGSTVDDLDRNLSI